MRILHILSIALFLLPSVFAVSSVTSAAVASPHVETRTQHLSYELTTGRSVVMLRLDKNNTEPVLDVRISGYAVGNFTVWLEPVGSDERYLLMQSKQLQREPLWEITGFAAGNNGNGQGNGNNGGNDAPGNSGNAPGHDSNGPGNSENAPGHNKVNKATMTNRGLSKGIARRGLESMLNRLQGLFKGQEKRNARNKALQDTGYLLTPVRFRDTCAQTCALPRPLMYRDYRLVADVDGKIDLQAVHYAVIADPTKK